MSTTRKPWFNVTKAALSPMRSRPGPAMQMSNSHDKDNGTYNDNGSDHDIRATFKAAEHEGIRLAIKGRFVAIVGLSVWYLLTRSDPAGEVLLIAGVLFALGLAHYALTGSRYDRAWVKYVFITIDIIALTVGIVMTPEVAEIGLPPTIIFRFDLFPFYFIVMAVAAFSFSPGMVVWTGVASGAAWMAADGV